MKLKRTIAVVSLACIGLGASCASTPVVVIEKQKPKKVVKKPPSAYDFNPVERSY